MKVSKTIGKNKNMELFANVNNLLDRDPLPTPTAIGRAGTGGAIMSSMYDLYGRRYTVGLNYSF
jgi:outer membrane receptor protein involved in Fe transport